MSSLREQCLSAIQAALFRATDAGERVYRGRRIHIEERPWPTITIAPQREESDVSQKGHYLTRRLVVAIIVYGRFGTEMQASGDEAADQVCIDLHAAIMADETLGGIAMRTSPLATEWSFSDDDSAAAMVECTYEILYSTRRASLTERP